MSKIDYVMGFLTADGCVSKDRYGNACSLTLELSDKQIVEDIARDVYIELDRNPRITYFEVEAVSFESIHNHNAYAYIHKDKTLQNKHY